MLSAHLKAAPFMSAMRPVATPATRTALGHLVRTPVRSSAGAEEAPERAREARLDRWKTRGGKSGSSDFGALLRRHRLAAGLSQESLAERARMSLTESARSNAAIAGRRNAKRSRSWPERWRSTTSSAKRSRRPPHGRARATRGGDLRDGGTVAERRGPSLPLALTSFVGREAELDEIAALIARASARHDHRSGRRRQDADGAAAATACSDADEGPVCFVALAPIGDPSLVATAIAAALGVQEVPNHPLLETLVAFLKNKTMLLLLDNCEHVIAEAATVADSLLRACPNLRILATSREPLGGRRAHLSSAVAG